MSEDRFKLSGEIETDTSVVIWMTQRLLCRLVPILLQGLEKQTPAAPHSITTKQAAEELQGFAQQVARSELKPQATVRSQSGDPMWLAEAVDVAMSKKRLSLSFRSQDGQSASLTLAPKELRQWLSILYAGWIKAQWQQELWPNWIKGEETSSQQQIVLH